MEWWNLYCTPEIFEWEALPEDASLSQSTILQAIKLLVHYRKGLVTSNPLPEDWG